MRVTSQGIKEITNILINAAKELNVPVVATLEGGYNYNATAQGILDTLFNMVNA
jgi:Histone deacetylase domain.